MFVNADPFEAVTASVANFTDIALSYFFARFIFRTPRDFRTFLILMVPGLAVVASIIMIESISHNNFVYQTTSEIFGEQRRFKFQERLGLLRGFGPFPHPILAGIFLASFLPLFSLSGIKGWPRTFGLFASVCAFFSLSSAAFLGFFAGLFAVIYNWFSEKYRQLSWRSFLLLGSLFLIVVEFGSQNGVYSVLSRYAALNVSSARNRLAIWEHGTRNVADNPWFGIGYNDWERPDWMLASVDHYWLLLAMQFGAIVPFIIGFVVAVAVINASRASMLGPLVDRRLLRGLAISLAILAFGLFSVSIWLSVQTWFYLLTGICVSLSARTLELGKIAEKVRLHQVAWARRDRLERAVADPEG